MNAPHPFKQLLSQPDFVKLWTSQLLSQLTINLVNFSILIRVFEVTTSSVAISLLWMAYSLPTLFFAPFSGAIVDTFSRRRMMFVTNFLQAITVSLYLFVPAHRIFVLYVLVFIYSFLDQLYLPSQQASIPWLVDKKLLPVANGLFLLTQQGSFLVGFGLGGIFLSVFGRNTTTLLSTIFLLVAAVAVYLLPKDSPKTDRIEHDLGIWLNNFKKGYRFVRTHRGVLFPLLMVAFIQVIITIVSINLPSYTQAVLGLDLNHASLAFVVPGAAGALLFTFFLPHFLKHRRKKSIVELGLLLASISLFILSLLPLIPHFRLLIAIFLAVLIGMSIAGIIVPSHTLLQEKTPPWFRGRVYSSLYFLLLLATSIPLLVSATLADIIGVAPMMFTVSILLFVFYFFISRKGDHVLANGLGL